MSAWPIVETWSDSEFIKRFKFCVCQTRRDAREPAVRYTGGNDKFLTPVGHKFLGLMIRALCFFETCFCGIISTPHTYGFSFVEWEIGQFYSSVIFIHRWNSRVISWDLSTHWTGVDCVASVDDGWYTMYGTSAREFFWAVRLGWLRRIIGYRCGRATVLCIPKCTYAQWTLGALDLGARGIACWKHLSLNESVTSWLRSRSISTCRTDWWLVFPLPRIYNAGDLYPSITIVFQNRITFQSRVRFFQSITALYIFLHLLIWFKPSHLFTTLTFF